MISDDLQAVINNDIPSVLETIVSKGTNTGATGTMAIQTGAGSPLGMTLKVKQAAAGSTAELRKGPTDGALGGKHLAKYLPSNQKLRERAH